ncbi:endonuclease/exonuclease/phosphatase family protein [Ulvibacter antarcticus]|nr:endonuclease/exonuclease/phosphatase family protein [Ulvibacter antarcticus]
MTVVLYVISIIFIITPFLPAIENPHWFFRTADFVRLQSIVIEIVCLLLLFFIDDSHTIFTLTLKIGLIGAALYQIVKVFPYSSFYPRKKPKFESDGMLSVLAANVLQTNTSFGKFIEIINEFDPDIVLVMEGNENWESGLSEIEALYPNSIKIPLENYYGMLLYSKRKLQTTKTLYQVEKEVPSIFFEYEINETIKVFFSCLHPAPPSPTENESSKERDAELMITGKRIRESNLAAIVCGDMNDVVWSRVTRLFKKMTNMIDPRIGRGFFPTYHAGYFFMRFPLDHLFHSKDLFVGKMVRTRNFDSDHFGMYYEIHHKKNENASTSGTITSQEKADIKTLINNGHE